MKTSCDKFKYSKYKIAELYNGESIKITYKEERTINNAKDKNKEFVQLNNRTFIRLSGIKVRRTLKEKILLMKQKFLSSL